MMRPAAVAGRFYSADPRALARSVDALLDAVPLVAGSLVAGPLVTGPPVRAYVVPHAGHRYSGPTAAHVYARLRAAPDRVERVVLIGPAHFEPLRGCAVPAVDAWATPLGPVAIDAEARAAVVASGLAVVDDRPHAPEHSLEVQLPFLVRASGPGVRILPVAVGPVQPDAVADVIATANAPGTVVLCSTDLSHFLDEAAARAQDERTVAAILDLAHDRIGEGDACGRYALRGLIAWAARERLTPRLLDLTTSARTSGDPNRVVGYAALSLH